MTKTNLPLYRAAILLSIAIHVFFAAVAEAGLILSQKHNSEPVISFFTTSDSYTSLAGEGIKIKSEKDIVSKSDKKKVIKDIQKSTAQFHRQQKKLNQRINTIKNEVIEKQVSLLKSVDLSVYDLEKVPLHLRASFFSDYLTLMRLKITSEWIPALDQVSCQSCTAIVEYQIDTEGKISDLNLLESSGDLDFDRACLKAVSKSNPLPTLPFQFEKEIKSRYVTVSLTFYFEKKKAPVS